MPTAGLVVAIAVPLVPVLRDAPDTQIHEQEAVSTQFSEVIGPTVAAIEDGTVPGGPDGAMLVTWSDPVSLGGPGFSLLDELERRGYDVGFTEDYRLSVRDHRVTDPDEADAEIHIAFGVGAVDQARTHPGATEIASFDPRTDEQRQTYAELRDQIVNELVAADLEDALPDLDQNMMALATRGDIPASIARRCTCSAACPSPWRCSCGSLDRDPSRGHDRRRPRCRRRPRRRRRSHPRRRRRFVVGRRTSAPDADDATAGPRHHRRRRALLVLGLTAIVTLPLYIALAALRSPRWHPLLDLAMTEMRVRDTGTSHTPLVGLVGRLSSDGHQGSHLGPLSFWSLAPVYRVLGESAWSLLVGVVLLNTTAIALTIWAALRRGGTALALTFAAGLAVLVHLYGTTVLTEPWNPYLPVLWWTLAVVAVWSILCDDLAMLPVAVFAALFCLQTHVSYGVLVGGFTAARGGVPRRPGRAPARRPAGAGPPRPLDGARDRPRRAVVDRPAGRADHERSGQHVDRRRPLRQRRGRPRRGAARHRAVRGAPQPVAAARRPAGHTRADGAGRGAGRRLAGRRRGLAWRVGRERAQRPTLLRLHAVIAVSLALGFVSSTRILGFVWFYLTLWAWTTNLLMLIAIGWTAVLAVAARRALPTSAPPPGLAGAGRGARRVDRVVRGRCDRRRALAGRTSRGSWPTSPTRRSPRSSAATARAAGPTARTS